MKILCSIIFFLKIVKSFHNDAIVNFFNNSNDIFYKYLFLKNMIRLAWQKKVYLSNFKWTIIIELLLSFCLSLLNVMDKRQKKKESTNQQTNNKNSQKSLLIIWVSYIDKFYLIYLRKLAYLRLLFYLNFITFLLFRFVLFYSSKIIKLITNILLNTRLAM